MAEARCLAVARRLAAQVPQDGLAEKTWKPRSRGLAEAWKQFNAVKKLKASVKAACG